MVGEGGGLIYGDPVLTIQARTEEKRFITEDRFLPVYILGLC